MDLFNTCLPAVQFIRNLNTYLQGASYVDCVDLADKFASYCVPWAFSISLAAEYAAALTCLALTPAEREDRESEYSYYLHRLYINLSAIG